MLNNKLMFMYECLSDYKKELIDDEIETKTKNMILNNRGFNYSDVQFHAMLSNLLIYGEQINEFLGYSDDYFGVKELAVKSRAIKISYDIEQNRPHRELIEHYIELCSDLLIQPDTEVLFDNKYLSDLVFSLSNYRGRKNRGLLNHDEIKNSEMQLNKKQDISNNITFFEELFEDFYDIPMMS